MRDAAEAISHPITDYSVLTREEDGSGRWVGADMEVAVPPIGTYALTVMTKGYYKDSALSDHFEQISDVDPEDITKPSAVLPPFVLNDPEITDQVLETKFRNRIVLADLAACMWPVDPVAYDDDPTS